MILESLPCCHCETELQLLQGTLYVTCFQCHTYLRVHWEATPAYTEKAEQAEPHIQQAATLATNEPYQIKLDHLLQQWEEERKRYMIRGKNGDYTVPQVTSLLSPLLGMILLFAGIVSLIVIGILVSPFSPWLLFFPLFLFVLGGSAFVGIDQNKAQAYQEAQRRFQERIENLKHEYSREKSQALLSPQDLARLQFIQLLRTAVTARP